jgi:hypothetical protein
LAALLLVGVDFAQGYHISRPMPMMDITYPNAIVDAGRGIERRSGHALACVNSAPMD